MFEPTIIDAKALAVSRKGAVKRLQVLSTKEEVKQALADRKQLHVIQRNSRDIRSFGYYEVRQNGALKEWKTRPTHWSLPLKYGLRDCFRIDHTAHVSIGCGMLAIEAPETEEESI